VLKAYMDETGVHTGAPVVAVSAYVAKPAAWRSWTKKWNAAKRPIKVFHATDCANSRGEFEGWGAERRDTFVKPLLATLPTHRLFGMVIAIQMDDFNQSLAKHQDLVNKLALQKSIAETEA